MEPFVISLNKKNFKEEQGNTTLQSVSKLEGRQTHSQSCEAFRFQTVCFKPVVRFETPRLLPPKVSSTSSLSLMGRLSNSLMDSRNMQIFAYRLVHIIPKEYHHSPTATNHTVDRYAKLHEGSISRHLQLHQPQPKHPPFQRYL
jgi:hypothetical protein